MVVVFFVLLKVTQPPCTFTAPSLLPNRQEYLPKSYLEFNNDQLHWRRLDGTMKSLSSICLATGLFTFLEKFG